MQDTVLGVGACVGFERLQLAIYWPTWKMDWTAHAVRPGQLTLPHPEHISYEQCTANTQLTATDEWEDRATLTESRDRAGGELRGETSSTAHAALSYLMEVNYLQYGDIMQQLANRLAAICGDIYRPTKQHIEYGTIRVARELTTDLRRWMPQSKKKIKQSDGWFSTACIKCILSSRDVVKSME